MGTDLTSDKEILARFKRAAAAIEELHSGKKGGEDYDELIVDINATIEALEDKRDKYSLWEDDRIQFARLISEIVACEESLDTITLCESMDLEEEELQSLFDRAEEVFEQSKRAILKKGKSR